MANFDRVTLGLCQCANFDRVALGLCQCANFDRVTLGLCQGHPAFIHTSLHALSVVFAAGSHPLRNRVKTCWTLCATRGWEPRLAGGTRGWERLAGGTT
eukprot:363496-Chlamydomonas_euryale.AAC.1